MIISYAEYLKFILEFINYSRAHNDLAEKA